MQIIEYYYRGFLFSRFSVFQGQAPETPPMLPGNSRIRMLSGCIAWQQLRGSFTLAAV